MPGGTGDPLIVYNLDQGHFLIPIICIMLLLPQTAEPLLILTKNQLCFENFPFSSSWMSALHSLCLLRA